MIFFRFIYEQTPCPHFDLSDRTYDFEVLDKSLVFEFLKNRSNREWFKQQKSAWNSNSQPKFVEIPTKQGFGFSFNMLKSSKMFTDRLGESLTFLVILDSILYFRTSKHFNFDDILMTEPVNRATKKILIENYPLTSSVGWPRVASHKRFSS